MPSKITESLAPIASEAKLYTIAVESLRAAQLDVTKARSEFLAALEKEPPLLAALGNYYLARVAADMRHSQRMTAEAQPAKVVTAPDHDIDETQRRGVGSHPSSTAAEAGPASAVTTAPDQDEGETQRALVGSGHPSSADEAEPTETAQPSPAAIPEVVKSVKPAKTAKPEVMSRGHAGPHRRHAKMPSKLQLEAEKALIRQTTLFDTWKMRDGRCIGDLSWYELAAMAVDEVKIGLGFVVRGERDLIDGFACHLLAQHAAVPDQMSKVRDNLNEKALKRIESQARKLAKKTIDRVNQMPREILAELARDATAIEQR